jgi:hypothetical protein
VATPRPRSFGEPIEHVDRGFPVNAAVGDALAVAQLLADDQILPAADQMAAMIAQNAAVAQPTPKAGAPGDIAAAALFLASDEAAFVTGTHMVVDGGITVGPRHSWDPTAASPFAAILGMSPEDWQAAVGARGV